MVASHRSTRSGAAGLVPHVLRCGEDCFVQNAINVWNDFPDLRAARTSGDFPYDGFLPTPPTPPPNAHSPPIILEHPSDLIVPENEPVTLTCHAAGTPRPLVQWFRAGTGRVETATQNAGSRRIQLPDGSLFFLGTKETVDAGIYWCEAVNENGMARSKNATLAVACKSKDLDKAAKKR
eukprot:snap_masked-scaffold586_size129807-processed-gene-0.0 protein:Tk00298 transcript:snap_masked-scaffold586_size129807-processed-gene-0.0-mRNA-1 annotation:"roundabout homolog 2-like"